MQIFRAKKNKNTANDRFLSEMIFLYTTISSELKKTTNELENINHQLEFFGVTAELEQKKVDVELMLNWLNSQYVEVGSVLELNK